ncbi:hypothetical protein [Streptomyces olivoreticuli]|uniref:hypothetical protein n=1 Tax=Streptomyces olivoreticuli TaxID=68246 RepID=UPI000E234225|nr:hypothetical protein [Streptomyces olivoreticuli]
MNITTPGGLRTGPAGGCSDSLCWNAATRVLVHLANPLVPGSQDVQLGAYCLRCMNKQIAPAEQVARMDERAILFNDSNPPLLLPDDHWVAREFTDEEAAEMAAIHCGELLCTYVGPGKWEWRRKA